MGLIDFILNVVGFLLWLNWCTARLDPMARATARTLLGTLKPVAPVRFRRWPLLAWIALLLVARAIFYWELGPPLNWDPALDLGAVVLPFKSGLFGQALLFSLLSYVRIFVILYLWIIFLRAVAPPDTRENPAAKLLKLYLGRLAHWPTAVQLFIPFFAGAVLWIVLEPVLVKLGITLPAHSVLQLLGRAALVGVSSYVTLRWLIAFLLLVHLVDTYVYMGKTPALEFGVATAANLLRPLRKIRPRIGKIDLADLLGIALVCLIGEAVLWVLPRLYLP